ncbi:phage neck terminator protein [Allorhizobium ampelinum]|uniref:phage neck terminator protein n=1 Tax=Allorhizobium ampelinum TaxID=3025782 RepID=UPI000B69745B|nr:hypothetical protein [Allorhizobium ampelinum]OVE94454.1 hypothetical protein B7W85_12955 [Allorhizobium ampelinum]
MNTSATGGYLAPTSTQPADDDGLEDIIQAIVVGITGLDGTLVRPRWQPNPPKQPAQNANWCAIGVTRQQPDSYGAIVHSGSGDGSDTLQRHEYLDVLASFYGPQGQAYAGLFRDGLFIAQNREAMRANGLALYEANEIIAAPTLVNTVWNRRYDLSFRLRRQIDRTYDVLNILSADGITEAQTNTQTNTVTWTVQET